MSAKPEYADLEIRISKDQPGGYKVEITLDREVEFPAGELDPGLLPWVPSASPAEDGERLFAWLLADDALKAAWAEARGRYPQRRIRMRIDPDVPELHTVPWELLRDPGHGGPVQDLAAATASPFSRYLAGPWLPGSLIGTRPVRILVAIANPEDLPDYHLTEIDPEAEVALLQEAVGSLDVELVRLREPWTLAELGAALRQGVHILHLVAHGTFDERAGAALYLADAENRVEPAGEAELAAMLARQVADTTGEDRLQLVFLASCQTATRSPADAFRGLAPRLIEAGVPAVLAMQDPVRVTTAQAFARTFYERLLEKGLVDLACNEARSDLLAAGLPGAAIPVLFLRVKHGRLLLPAEAVHRGVYRPPTAQVFLCYARQDGQRVEQLYKALAEAGFKPWMDTKNIHAGERWEASIERAIRNSAFFLACLSPRSVNRRGYIQKEIKHALDVWEQMLMDDIYLIPVRIEPCEVPETLRSFQWVNLYDADGLTQLIKALQIGMERRQDGEPSRHSFESAYQGEREKSTALQPDVTTQAALFLFEIGRWAASELKERWMLTRKKEDGQVEQIDLSKTDEQSKQWAEAWFRNAADTHRAVKADQVLALIERKHNLIAEWRDMKVDLEEAFNRQEITRSARRINQQELDHKIANTLLEIKSDLMRIGIELKQEPTTRSDELFEAQPTSPSAPIPNRIYHIISKNSGKCLDVQGQSKEDGANVQQHRCHGGANQMWKLLPTADGCWLIIAEHSDMCLDVVNRGTGDRVNVQQHRRGRDDQKWELIDAGEGYYRIRAKHSGKCLDVEQRSTADGANVQQYRCHDLDNQKWKFELLE